MERTLLLTQSYEPIAAISWQRAVVLSMLGKAEVVEEYDEVIRSPNHAMRRPAVVRLLRVFRRRKQRMKFSKQNVFARDRWQCQYCGKRKNASEFTYDHVVPRSRGGKTCWENIVTACAPCNSRKANKTPEEAGMFPRTKPTRPVWIPVATVRVGGEEVPEQWRPYCYWLK